MPKLKERAERCRDDAKVLLDKLETACTNLASAKAQLVSDAIRSTLKDGKKSFSDLFGELASKDGDITEAAFIKFLKSLKGLDLSAEQQQLLVLRQHGGVRARLEGTVTLSRWAFLSMLQRFYKCVKEVAITDGFDIKNSESKRKLEVAEMVEVIENPQKDESLGLTRIHGRSMSDGTTGWITLCGNQGTPFLQKADKPFLVATSEIPLQNQFTGPGLSDTAILRAQEVAEVLEGPRKDSMGVTKRVKGKSTTDGTVGWFALTDAQGHTSASESNTTYICKSAIALTSSREIENCKVLRKLDKNEVLTGLSPPEADGDSGVLRVHCQATKDGEQGWVTLKGNAGTVYVQATGRQYSILRDVPLRRGFQATSAEIRNAVGGETFDVLEGPKEERKEPTVRARVRAASSGAEGWVSVKQGQLRLWAPRYKCLASVSLDEQLKAGSKVLRNLRPGEILDMVDGPKEYAAGGALRLKVRSKDGFVGWVTASGNLECIRSA